MPIHAVVKPLVGVAQLVELEAGAPVTEHSRRRFDSGHQHRASSDAARCANTLCGKYRMTNIEALCAIAHLWSPVAAGSVEETLLFRSWNGQPVPSAKVSKSGSRNKGLHFY